MRFSLRTKTFLICALILVIRGWTRLQHPAIWAEDGKIFLHDAFAQGWSTIFKPFVGSFFLIPRFFAAASTALPVYWIPFAITVFCFLLYAFCMAEFAGNEHSHLVPSPEGRIAIAAGACLVPGMLEVAGNLCNTHRPLAAWMLFLGLRRYEAKLRWWDLLLLFVAAGSAGEAFIFLPFLFYRGFKRFKSMGLKSLGGDLIAAIIIVGWTVATLAIHEAQPPGNLPTLSQVTKAVLAFFSSELILQPTVGWRMTMNLFKFPPAFWLAVAGISWAAFRGFRRRYRRFEIFPELAAGSFFAIQFLGWWVRPGSIELYQHYAPGVPWWHMRECFFLVFAGYLFWTLRIGRKSGRWVQAYILLYLLLAPKLAIEPYGDTSYWKFTSEELQSSIDTGCPKSVRIPTYPIGWSFVYESKKSADCTLKSASVGSSSGWTQ